MSNYSRGANLERKIKKRLESEGWFVVRSAGSKGLVDLVAFASGQKPVFIQVKLTGKLSKLETINLIELAERYDAMAMLSSKDGDVFLV